MKYYYTYELIDPRTDQVFYVGKGQDKRMYSHFLRVKKGYFLENKHLENKLQQLVKENLNPKYRIVFKTIEEQEAYNKEIELIKYYGKENLCNLTDGGEGPFNCLRSEETKEKIRKKAIERNKSDEYRKMISIKTKQGMNNPVVKERLKKIFLSQEHRQKISETTKKVLAKPEIKEKMKKAQQGKNNGFYNFKHSNEWKKQHSIAISGENNPMFGKSLFDCWVDKYGLEEAIQKYENWKTKLKLVKSK